MPYEPNPQNSAIKRDCLEEGAVHKLAITTSTDLETAASATLNERCGGCIIYNNDSSVALYAAFDGTAATANSFIIPAGAAYQANGTREKLREIRLYAASEIDVRVLELTVM